MKCDVVIVGAGPSGLSAARALAEKNLNVVVVDRKSGAKNISPGIMEMLSLQPNKIDVTDEKIFLKESGFGLDRKKAIKNEIYGFTVYSPCFNSLALVSKFPTNFAVDYKYWIDKIEKEALKSGAKIIYRHEVIGLIYENDKVAGIKCADEKGGEIEIRAALTIGADGIRSKIARLAGFKKERWGIHRIIGWRMKNFDIGLTRIGNGYNPKHHNMYLGGRFAGPNALSITADLGENEAYIINVIQTKDLYEKPLLSPEDSLEKFMNFLRNNPPCSEAYRKTSGGEKFCFLLPVDSPLPKPFEKKGVFLIGDACFTIETQWTGAMAVATKASDCIVNVLNDSVKSGDYFSEYERWWGMFVRNARRQYDFTTFMHSLGDEELDEFMGLFEEDIRIDHLKGTDDEFGTPNEFIIRVNDRLSKVNPEEVKSPKIKMVVKMIQGQAKQL